jgi:nucleotide-binding universal stress UspA family protein
MRCRGHSGNLILKRAKDADLIVMGERGEGAKWAGPLLGSTFSSSWGHTVIPVF